VYVKYWFEILGGVLIVLSSLVGEEMRRRRKWAVYLIFAALAVIYIVVGIQIDRASEKRESEAAMEAKDSRAALLQSQNDLIKTQGELISKSDEIARLNEEIASSVTGGNEFAYLQAMLADDGQQHRLFLIVAHKGKYPIYDVGFRVLDLRVGGREPYAAEVLSNTFNVGTLAPHQLHFVAYWPLVLPMKTHYGFNFFFTARNTNGFVVQELRYVKVGAKWLSATRVTPLNNNQHVLYRQIDAGFPKKANGTIDWNDNAYSD
jgi:hypothetical protein